jgi:hypothetical protein
MRKLIIGVVAAAATIGFLSVIRRRAHEVRGHCERMAAKCKEKMAQFGAGEAAEMPEHCKEMAAATRKEKAARSQAGRETPMPERSEPTVAAHGDHSEALSTS